MLTISERLWNVLHSLENRRVTETFTVLGCFSTLIDAKAWALRGFLVVLTESHCALCLVSECIGSRRSKFDEDCRQEKECGRERIEPADSMTQYFLCLASKLSCAFRHGLITRDY